MVKDHLRALTPWFCAILHILLCIPFQSFVSNFWSQHANHKFWNMNLTDSAYHGLFKWATKLKWLASPPILLWHDFVSTMVRFGATWPLTLKSQQKETTTENQRSLQIYLPKLLKNCPCWSILLMKDVSDAELLTNVVKLPRQKAWSSMQAQFSTADSSWTVLLASRALVVT